MMIQEEEDKYRKRRFRSAYVNTVLSISLVLFLLGLQGLMLLYSQKIADYVRENIGFTVVMKDYTREQDIIEMQTLIDSLPAVKSTRYISKDEAAKELTADLGEDFVAFLGFNPLLPSVEVRLNADYTHSDSIAQFEYQIKRYHIVKEIYYREDMVSLVNDNIKTISFWLLLISALVLLVALTLINSTVRLHIYAKRLIINSMQLVGATGNFIRRPFLKSALIQSVASGIIASILLSGLLFYLHEKIPVVIGGNEDLIQIAFLFLGLILFSIFFTLICTYFAVSKFIKMRNHDEIHQ